jgi:large subunit ribosomal protein L9
MLLSAGASARSEGTTRSIFPSCFVSPAVSPARSTTIGSDSPVPWVADRSNSRDLSSRSRNGIPAIVSATQLASKKKAAAAATKKIQVRLLKYIHGTGLAGEVINVTPAFYQNKLRPQKLAELISDEEVKVEKVRVAAVEKATREKANELKEKLTGLTLQIKRTSGPDGKLFGGIGSKAIMDEIKTIIVDDFLDGKGVKVQAITDEEGNKLQGDIKHTGNFGATIALTPDISATIEMVVASEN